MSVNPYTFIGLTNDVLEHLTEVPLTSSTFASAGGFHKVVKSSINAAIEDIYNEQKNQWKWQLTERTFNAIIGSKDAYTLDSSGIDVDWDSFYIPKDAARDKPEHQELIIKDFDYYTTFYRKYADEALTADYDIPKYIIQGQDNKAFLYPIPDDTYPIKYNSFTEFTPLSGESDVPLIPKQYRKTIFYGALRYVYENRDDMGLHDRANRYYKDWVAKMRQVYIPQATNMRYS